MTVAQVHNYPEFVPNQILTNDQLNKLRDYLDEQNRLTRIRTIGMGIICGLNPGVKDLGGGQIEIHISKGYGISSEGYLIELGTTLNDTDDCNPPAHDDSPVVFVSKRKYRDPFRVSAESDPGVLVDTSDYCTWRDLASVAYPGGQKDIIELLTQEVANELTPEQKTESSFSASLTNADWVDRVLVLYLEMDKESLKSCLTTDCNKSGQEWNMKVRALLVKKTDLKKAGVCEMLPTPIYVPRFHEGLKQTGDEKDAIPDITDAKRITEAYSHIVETMRPVIIDRLQQRFTDHGFFLDLKPQPADVIDKLGDLIPDEGEYNQYHYDFVKDLAQAMNEFEKHVCGLVKDCCPQTDYPRHLMLGNYPIQQHFRKAAGTWRHLFSPSPARNVMYADIEKAQKLYLRILALINNFAIPAVAEDPSEIIITPSQTEAFPLGERAVPYYYRKNMANVRWQPKMCCTSPPYSYHHNDMELKVADPVGQANPLLVNILAHTFLRIEGHLGFDIDQTIERLEEIRLLYNLDFHLRKIGFNANIVSDFSELTFIANRLATNYSKKREVERLLYELMLPGQPFQDSSQKTAGIFEVIQEIRENYEDIDLANQNWQKKRLAIVPRCDISFLQSDYHTFRASVFCVFQKLEHLLVGLPGFNLLGNIAGGCFTFDSAEAPVDLDDIPVGVVFLKEDSILAEIQELSNAGGQNPRAFIEEAGNQFGHEQVLNLRARSVQFQLNELQPDLLTLEFENRVSNRIEIAVNEEIVFSGLLTDFQQLEDSRYAISIEYQENTQNEVGAIYLAVKEGFQLDSMSVGGNRLRVDTLCALHLGDNDLLLSDVYTTGFSREGISERVEVINNQMNDVRTQLNTPGADVIALNRLFDLLSKEKLLYYQVERLYALTPGTEFTLGDTAVFEDTPLSPMSKYNLATLLIGYARQHNGDLMTMIMLLSDLLWLREKVSRLLTTLPNDVRGFNHVLFKACYKEVNLGLIELRLVIFNLVENLITRLTEIVEQDGPPELEENLSPMLRLLLAALAYLPKAMDINAFLSRARYNCLHGEATTIYEMLEQIISGQNDFIGDYLDQLIGMEHQAGVERGGTFILVYREDGDDKPVVADFTLRGSIEDCCCKVDMSSLCLPPVALPDYHIVPIFVENKNDVNTLIDVLTNDLALGPNRDVQIALPSSGANNLPTTFGGSVEIEEDSFGRQQIRYRNTQVYTPIDRFRYFLIDNDCKKSDLGEVLVVFKNYAPIIAQPEPDPTGSISGIVLEADSPNAVLTNATVRLTVTGGSIVTTYTDNSGRFRFSNLTAGTYQIQVSMPCYQTVTLTRDLNPSLNGNNDINLGQVLLQSIRPVRKDCVEGGMIHVTAQSILDERTLQHRWKAANCYFIDGVVTIPEGHTLEIEAGTIIKGIEKPTDDRFTLSALHIAAGASIIAKGTKHRPVIFTCETDNLQKPDELPFEKRGVWGGLIINGKISRTINRGDDPFDVRRGPTDLLSVFRLDDSSGILSYVSIRYAGKSISEKIPLGGLSLFGVGSGTELEHVEVFGSGNYGFLFNGGTVRSRYLVSAFNAASAFFTTGGFAGQGQFWFSIDHEEDRRDVSLASVQEGDSRTSQHTLPEVYNATFIGVGSNAGARKFNAAFLFNEVGGGTFSNSIFTDYSGCYIKLSEASLRLISQNEIQFRRNIWWDFRNPHPITRKGTICDFNGNPINNEENIRRALLDQTGNINKNPSLLGITRLMDGQLDPRPKSNIVLVDLADVPSNSWFVKAPYKGAFSPKEPLWLKCWTALHEHGYLFGVSTGGTQGAVVLPGVLTDRYNDNLSTIRDLLSSGEITVNTAIDKSNDFLATMKELTPEERSETIPEVIKDLSAEMENASGQEKKAYRDIMRTLTHTYLDLMVNDRKDELTAADKESLETVTKELENADINLRGVKNSWKGSTLRNELDAGKVVTEINGFLEPN